VNTALVRTALVAVALFVAAWLVLSLRAVELGSEGRAVLDEAVTGELAPDEVRHGRSLLQRARRFNADKAPLIDESVLLREAGRREEAAALVEQAVADEPDNVDGWIILAGVTDDPRRAAEARRKVRELNPRAAEVLREASAGRTRGR
jgi:hypothetical protein